MTSPAWEDSFTSAPTLVGANGTNPSPFIYPAGITAYSIVLFVCILDYFWAWATDRYRKTDDEAIDKTSFLVEVLFKSFISFFLIARIVWLTVYDIYGQSFHVIFSFPLSRCIFALYFTAFILVVYYWVSNAHKLYFGANSFLATKLSVILAIINSCVWIFQIVAITVFLTLQKDDTPITRQSIRVFCNLSDVVISFIVSISFLFYGLVWARLRYHSDLQDPKRVKDVIKILGVTIVFTMCFMLKVIISLIDFLFVGFLSPNLLISLTYFVPELIVVSLMVFLVEGSKSRRAIRSKFISDLYKGEADVTFEDDYNSINNFNENSIKALLINSWGGVSGPDSGQTNPSYSSTTSRPTSGTTSSIND